MVILEQKISKIEETWNYLCDKCNSLPFQNYEIMKALNSIPYVLRTRGTVSALVVYENDIPVMIVPIRRKSKESIAILGSVENMDFVDIVYNTDFCKEKLLCALEMVFLTLKQKGVKEIVWNYLNENSLSNELLAKLMNADKINFIRNEISNVRISLAAMEYEKYFNQLSKHVRQNLRTAYNRAYKDGHVITFHVYNSQVKALNQDEKARKANNKYMELYLKRLKERYNVSKFQLVFRKHSHYVSQSVLGKSGFMADICVDDKIAAFVQGYIDERHSSVFIPRLATDNQYARYSPGMCLVNEIVKYLMDNCPTLKYFDLDRGTEKYKCDMGGEIYFTYSYSISI